MNNEDALNLIRTNGDLLEQHMFSNGSFASDFSIYPQVWARYVLPNRKPTNPALANQEWLRFAERHYSTIVRCWNMRQAQLLIDRICESACDKSSADNHLELHGALLTFYCSAGAAIDNMQKTFAAPPLNREDEFLKIRSRDSAGQNLAWLYDRRTQYVHKAIVPCFMQKGLLSVDQSFYDDTETAWDNQRPLDTASAESLVSNIGKFFQHEMHSAWCVLLDLLKTTQLSEAPLELPQPSPQEITWCSASSVEPEELANLPWPSGT